MHELQSGREFDFNEAEKNSGASTKRRPHKPGRLAQATKSAPIAQRPHNRLSLYIQYWF